ncbi:hypothetical protein U0070_006340, partial [Myodes glareolus]
MAHPPTFPSSLQPPALSFPIPRVANVERSCTGMISVEETVVFYSDLSDIINLVVVTNSMFGASRKKFVEGVDSDYHDENMYYSQSSMFPHRSEKD